MWYNNIILLIINILYIVNLICWYLRERVIHKRIFKGFNIGNFNKNKNIFKYY